MRDATRRAGARTARSTRPGPLVASLEVIARSPEAIPRPVTDEAPGGAAGFGIVSFLQRRTVLREGRIPSSASVWAIRREPVWGRRGHARPVRSLRSEGVDDPAVDRRAGHGVEAGHLAAGEVEDVLVPEDSPAVGLPVMRPMSGRDPAQALQQDVDRLPGERELKLQLLRPCEGALDRMSRSPQLGDLKE